MKTPVLITFSGGRSSALACMLSMHHYNRKEYELHILFANTGKERPETLEFVNRCASYWNIPIIWLEAKFLDGGKTQRDNISFSIVNYETASRNGKPYKEMISKFGVPNRVARFCTSYLKIEPMNKYMLSLGYKNESWITVLGIRHDEKQRLSNRYNFGEHFILDDWKVTNSIVRNFWRFQEFDLKLKDYQGNCDLCFLKGLNKRKTILFESPEIADWWIEQENINKSSFHNNLPVEEILKLSKQKFTKVMDSFEKSNTQFDIWEANCFCGD